MMKKNNYFLYLIIAIIIVLTSFGLLHYLKIIQLPVKLFLLVNILIPVLFLGGAMIITVGKYKNPDSFAQRFMLLTTFQLLTILSVIAAVWYISKIHLKAFGLQFVSVFVLLMFIQSFLLVRLGRTENNQY